MLLHAYFVQVSTILNAIDLLFFELLICSKASKKTQLERRLKTSIQKWWKFVDDAIIEARKKVLSSNAGDHMTPSNVGYLSFASKLFSTLSFFANFWIDIATIETNNNKKTLTTNNKTVLAWNKRSTKKYAARL